MKLERTGKAFSTFNKVKIEDTNGNSFEVPKEFTRDILNTLLTKLFEDKDVPGYFKLMNKISKIVP